MAGVPGTADALLAHVPAHRRPDDRALLVLLRPGSPGHALHRAGGRARRVPGMGARGRDMSVVAERPAGIATTDHKRVAVRAAVTAAMFFAAGSVLALVMRAELARPGLQIVSTGTYNALFTMHGSTMIYLVITPFALALGLYLVPLQVGARGIAGARW